MRRALGCAGFSPHPVSSLNKTGGRFPGQEAEIAQAFSAQRRNRVRESGERRQATGASFVVHAGDLPISIPSESNRRSSRTLPHTHWKEKRVTHVTRVRASLAVAAKS